LLRELVSVEMCLPSRATAKALQVASRIVTIPLL
jgi:hypothetical protein